MEKIIASGKNLQTALAQGAEKLGVSQEDLEYNVICAGGFLRQCKVEVWKKPTEGDKCLEFLQNVLQKAGFDAKVDIQEDDEKIVLNIISDKGGDIIGHRGDTLESLRFLTAISLKGEESKKQVILDCNDYRQKRCATLEKLAKNLEKKAVRTGRKVRLEPMNAYERRIIHTTLKESEEVETFSEGTEPYRYIVIQPKGYQKKKFTNKQGKQYHNNRERKYTEENEETFSPSVEVQQTTAQEDRPKRKKLNFVYRTKTKRRF